MTKKFNRLVNIFKHLAQDKDEAGWKTINGAKVLIGPDGTVEAGLGGKVTGKKLSALKTVARQQKQTNKSSTKNTNKSNESNKSNLDPSKSVTGLSAELESLIPLKPEETDAFYNYTDDIGNGSNYDVINQSLRKGKSLDQEHQKIVDNMDSAFSRASTNEQITVYRGLNPNFTDKLEIGSSFTDDGFTSTSSELDVAKKFSSGGAVMEVIVPKGSKAISLFDIPAHPNLEGENEHEIVLNRGGRYTVRDKISGNPPRIIVEYSDA